MEIGNVIQMMSQFNEFKNMLKKSGKDPKQVLDELIKSGKVTKEQVENAKQLAEYLKGIMS